MRGFSRLLRMLSGCWFWLSIFGAVWAAFISTNVATGAISWPSRLMAVGVWTLAAITGFAAWVLTSQWIEKPRPEPRGFHVLPTTRDGK